MERLIVKNFISIKHAQVEIKDFNIIIGPQASGKSVLLKLIFYFKSIPYEILKYFQNKDLEDDILTHLKEKFVSYFPEQSWGEAIFNLEYYNDKFFFKLYRIRESDTTYPIGISYSESFEELVNKAKQLIRESEQKLDTDLDFLVNLERKYYNLVQEISSNNLSWGQIFVPAGRSFFSNLQANIFTFLNSNQSIDPFLAQFGSVYQSFKKIYNDKFFRIKNGDKKIESYLYQILKAYYKRENDEDFLIHEDKRKVNILNASSGQQEILPLLLILAVIKYVKFIGGGMVIYIEEPEAHLFPEAQYQIIKLLAYIFNTRKPPIQIFISTHSPYILSSVNNLMYASLLYEKLDDSRRYKILEIIPKDEFLPSDSVSAYAITYNKTLESVIDFHNRLITETFLDQVSDIIMETFDSLLKLDDYE